MKNKDQLPSSWVHADIAAVARIEMGQSPDSIYYNGERDGLPFFQGKTEFGPRYPVVRKWCSEPKKIAEAGDILLSIRAPVGPSNIALERSAIGRGLAAIGAESSVSQPYLFYFFRHIESWLSSQGTGSTFAAISGDFLRAIKVPVAPAAEQTRIVEKLEELLSDLDAGVAELKAAQKKLTRYRQSLLKAAVEGALTAQWRAAQSSGQPGAPAASAESGAALLARILSERRSRWETRQLAKFAAQGKTPPKDWQAKYPAPAAPDNAGLPALPQGWVWASAEQLCDFVTKGTTPPKGLNGAGDKVIPFLRVTNLTDKGVLDMADKVFVSEETHRGFLARSVVYPNDVLMNIVGPPLGQVSVVPETFPEWNINQAIAIFRAVEGVLSGFLSLTLLSPPAQHWLKARSKTTAGQTNLTLEVCRSLPIPLPPQAEQAALIAVADEAISRVAEQARAIQISLKQSAAQRKNILQAAFSGQLVAQDPADEPASALLARIRAERAARASGAVRGRGKKKDAA